MTDPALVLNAPAPGESVSDALAAVHERLAASAEPVVVVSSELLVATAALAPLTADPFAPTTLLVRPAADDSDVRVRHHLVTSVGSGFHSVTAPDHRSVGALRIASADVPSATAAVSELRQAIGEGAVVGSGHDLVELIAVALVRSGVSVRAVDMVDVPWSRDAVGPQADAARASMSSADDARIARLQANRVDDGFYSTFVVRRLSKPLTRIALRLGWSPNAITLLSFAIGIAAAGAFAFGERWSLVVGAVLLQLSLIVDCVDGEVARATRRFSVLGAWLDASTDRVKEFLAYAGLAIGAARFGVDIWWIAIVLVVLQTTRHMTDYDFSRVQRLREAHVPIRDVRLPDDGAAGASGGWSVSSAMEMSTRMNRREAVRWAKRAIHLPIGERWLIISLFAAVLGATWALGVLLVAGLCAFAYVLAGRTLRTTTWRGPTPGAGALMLARQADAGPVLSLVGLVVPKALVDRVWRARAAWALPALLRLVELGTVAVIAVVLTPAATVVAFWWMALVAYHHYDTLYRAMQDRGSPRWITLLGLGWEGRTVVAVCLTIAGASALKTGMTWGAWVMVALFVVVASVQWLSVQAKR